MVEVEDISLVPKSILCSYKAISDNVYRKYNVTLIPTNLCLPVSEINEANYKLYEEEGGMGGSVEEAWSAVSARPQGSMEKEVESSAKVAKVEQQEEARLMADQVQDDLPPAANTVEGQRGIHNTQAPLVAVSAGEMDRRRKGKGLMYPQAHGPTRAERLLRPTYEHSGSDSFDPMEMGAQLWVRPEAMSSEDADSMAGPVAGSGPINRSGEAQVKGVTAGVEEEAESVGEEEVNKETQNEVIVEEGSKAVGKAEDGKAGSEEEHGGVARRSDARITSANDYVGDVQGVNKDGEKEREPDKREGSEKRGADLVRVQSSGSTGSVRRVY